MLTDAELSELRYSGRAAAVLRGVKAIYFGTVFNCVVLAMVLFAAREITQPFLLWSRWLPAPLFDSIRSMVEAVGVPLARAATSGDVWTASTDNAISIGAIVGVTLLYSTTGGLRSVVRTDVVQFAIMMVATLAYAWIVVGAAGGLDGIHDALVRRYADGSATGGLTARELLAFTPSQAKDASFVLLALLGLQWLAQMNADGTGYLAQRADGVSQRPRRHARGDRLHDLAGFAAQSSVAAVGARPARAVSARCRHRPFGAHRSIGKRRLCAA